MFHHLRGPERRAGGGWASAPRPTAAAALREARREAALSAVQDRLAERIEPPVGVLGRRRLVEYEDRLLDRRSQHVGYLRKLVEQPVVDRPPIGADPEPGNGDHAQL